MCVCILTLIPCVIFFWISFTILTLAGKSSQNAINILVLIQSSVKWTLIIVLELIANIYWEFTVLTHYSKWVFFLVTALLGYNSHTQFTLLKCTIQWFLVYSQSYAAITTVNFRIFSSTPKGTLPLAATFQSSLPVGKHWSTFCLYRFIHTGRFPEMELYNVSSFVSGFFHSA